MKIRPNIVLFFLDQLSARWLESAASAACPTPNIERLRKRGVTFRNALSSNPVCMPARASLATGLTTRQHGVLQNGYALDPTLPTFMRSLQCEGWRTGAFGKVHFSPHFAHVYPDYRPYGFDVTHITEDPRAGEWLDWVEENHPDHYRAALATIWAAWIPELKRYGPRGIDLQARIASARKGFSFATPQFPNNTPKAYTLPFPREVSQTEWITRHAIDFVRGESPDQPILAQMGYVQPHSPFCAPAEFMSRVDTARIPAPAGAEWRNDPLAPQCFAGDHRVAGAELSDWRRVRQYYLADIAHLDEQLGKVVDALEQSGRSANTYLILLADHGEMLLDHGLVGKGEMHYDACVRVPLIIAGPGLRCGDVRDEMVRLEDVCATILDMGGVQPPEVPVGPYLKTGRPAVLAGRSLLPLCRGESVADWPQALLISSYNNIDSANPRNWARTVRTAEWRYTVYPEGGGEQLFHLARDPDEQHNLAGDSSWASVRREMRDRLLELLILEDYPHTPRSLFAHGVH